LRHLDKVVKKRTVDVLMGFPVDASLSSFLRNKRTHLGDLVWYGRLINPLSALGAIDAAAVLRRFDRVPHTIAAQPSSDRFSLTTDREFEAWRQQWRKPHIHGYFHHGWEGKTIRFDVKLEQGGRVKALTPSAESWPTMPTRASLGAGLPLASERLGRKVGHAATIALNPQSRGDPIMPPVRRHLIVPMRRRVHVIVMGVRYSEPDLSDGDVDTW
jgi:hypothetical protein